MSLIVLSFLHSASLLSFYIDVVLTLSIEFVKAVYFTLSHRDKYDNKLDLIRFDLI